MEKIEMEYNPSCKEYIIRIPISLLETEQGKEYFEEFLLKGVSDNAIVKEQIRRIKHRNREWGEEA